MAEKMFRIVIEDKSTGERFEEHTDCLIAFIENAENTAVMMKSNGEVNREAELIGIAKRRLKVLEHTFLRSLLESLKHEEDGAEKSAAEKILKEKLGIKE